MVCDSQSAAGPFLLLGEMFYQYKLLDVVQHTGSGEAHMPKTQFDLGACPAE